MPAVGKGEEEVDESESRKFGRWLNRAIRLRPNRVTRKIEVVELGETLFEELGLGGRNRNRKMRALNCILANLFLANNLFLPNWPGVPVMYSRDHHRYSRPKGIGISSSPVATSFP
jgi:hypothetical protein